MTSYRYTSKHCTTCLTETRARSTDIFKDAFETFIACQSVRLKVKKAGRNSGDFGAAFIGANISSCFQRLLDGRVDCVFLDSSIQNLTVILGCVHFNSEYCCTDDIESVEIWLSVLINEYPDSEYIICRNLNSRTGAQSNCISFDNIDYLPIDDATNRENGSPTKYTCKNKDQVDQSWQRFTGNV